MSRFYRRKEPSRRENLKAGLVAGGVAAAVAAVSFYVTRLFVSREPLEPLDSSESEDEVGKGTQGGGI